MILKQNCFVISEAEQNALETDNYTSPNKTSFTGSSIQRRFKVTQEISLKEKSDPKNSDQKTDHKMSDRTKAKIRQKLTAWANCIPKKQSVKFSFVTLTLTSKQIGDDKAFTKMQNVLFTYLRKYSEGGGFSFKNYLYVLEKQKNGNMHSHIVVSSFIPIRLINRLWCKILSDHGYTYKQGANILSPIQALINSSRDKTLSTPSPVDISCVWDLKKVSSYITKYITKNETVLTTQVWNCSNSISRIWTGARICSKKYMTYLEQFVAKKITKLMDNGQNLYIHVLKEYTGLQKKVFSEVNSPYLFA